MSVVGRLAPSPTGALHLGNARSFLLAWLSVRSRGGRLILRMEDLDHPKVKPGAAEEALDDLRWLGLDWDEGPDLGGPNAPYVQSQRTAFYRDALERLMGLGLVYPCACTRRDVERANAAPHADERDGAYPGFCLHRFGTFDEARVARGDGQQPAWRFRAPADAVRFDDAVHGPQRVDIARTVGDFVLARHPDGAGYQLAVVVDDYLMGVNEVLRGDDLLETTAQQIAVAEALGYPRPRYAHVPLVVGADGRRLAKRHGDTRLRAFREAGVAPERIVGWLAQSCGWAEHGEQCRPTDLLERFDLSTLSRQPVVYR